MGIRQWPEKGEKFLKEVKIEMQKVSWPDREKVIGFTIVVLVSVFVVSIYMWGIDYVYAKILEAILELTTAGKS